MAAPVAHAAIAAARNRQVRAVVIGVIGVVITVLITPFLLVGFALTTVLAPADDSFPDVAVVGGWAHPLGEQKLWNTYPNHSGGAVDFPTPVGTPVYAAAAGIVWDLSEPCGGTVLGVQHAMKLTTVVAHLSRTVVRAGEQVTAGQLIGYSGESGQCSTGPHLHFEIRMGDSPDIWGRFTPAFQFMIRHEISLGPCGTGCFLYPMM